MSWLLFWELGGPWTPAACFLPSRPWGGAGGPRARGAEAGPLAQTPGAPTLWPQLKAEKLALFWRWVQKTGSRGPGAALLQLIPPASTVLFLGVPAGPSSAFKGILSVLGSTWSWTGLEPAPRAPKSACVVAF